MKVLLFLSLICFSTAHAKTTKLKLAFLAPEGTNWANSLTQMGKEIKKETNNRVKFKLYFGGVAGDESDVLRKVRAGQFHGGIFTGKTLGDIYPDARLMEIPFTFTNKKDKALPTMLTLEGEMQKGFNGQGFQSLGLYEIGHVYLVTTKPVENLDSLKGIKIWTWEGDKIVEAMMKTLGLVSVPLALPDVLSSLSTGVIQAAYAPPLGITALQWHTKVKYLVNYPVAYSIGSLLIGKKAWNKISAADQDIIKKIAKKHIDLANAQTGKDNDATLASFKELGIKFVDFPATDYSKSSTIRNDVIGKLKGKVFNPKELSRFEGIVKKL